jgi:hypothetical protein
MRRSPVLVEAGLGREIKRVDPTELTIRCIPDEPLDRIEASASADCPSAENSVCVSCMQKSLRQNTARK